MLVCDNWGRAELKLIVAALAAALIAISSPVFARGGGGGHSSHSGAHSSSHYSGSLSTEPLLLDAAHIFEDKDERLGQLVVPNGIPFSKIHHAAVDAHIIGIDPDYRLHVPERLLELKDGPMKLSSD
jgi:hypothetical protein